MGNVTVGWGASAPKTLVWVSLLTLGMGLVTGVAAAASASAPVASHTATEPRTTEATLAALTREGWINAREDRAVLAATLKTGLITRANFVMRRTLTAQGLTLTSRGDVDATQPNEWIWNQTRPFAQRYRVSGTRIRVERAGAAPEDMTMSDNAQFAQWASLFKGLVSLDIKAIETHFTVDAFLRDPKGKGWVAVLRPRDTMLAKAMTEVVLRGNPTLTDIAMRAPDGDTTSVTLSPYTPAPVSSSAAPTP